VYLGNVLLASVRINRGRSEYAGVAGGDAAAVFVDAGLNLWVRAQQGLRPPSVEDLMNGRQIEGFVSLAKRSTELGFELLTAFWVKCVADRWPGAVQPIAYAIRRKRDIGAAHEMIMHVPTGHAAQRHAHGRPCGPRRPLPWPRAPPRLPYVTPCSGG
jgi:hypothetical protein